MKRFAVLGLCVAALVVLGAGSGNAQEAEPGIPGLVRLDQLRFEIVDATFITSLEGEEASYNESRPDEFHAVAVTVRISKPAGAALVLHPADVALHYRRANGDYDVAPCNGVSDFSTAAEIDRPMNFFSNGFGSISTGVTSQKSDVLFADLFFQNMEPDTRELHLLIAQPTGARFMTEGWAPGPAVPGTELDGVWEDTSTSTRMTIVPDGAGYNVVSAVDDGGEEYVVSAVSWLDGVLRWSYKVPSTGYVVNWTTVELRGAELETRWDGTAGSGTEILRRVGVAPTGDGALAGIGIRLIHVARRADDAREAARLLGALGAAVQLFETSETGNEPHVGKLYTRSGYEAQAEIIRGVVAKLEPVVEAAGDPDAFEPSQQFNLWMVR